MAEVFANHIAQSALKQPILETAYYDRKELATLVGQSLSTIIREENKGRLKARRIGRRVGFLGQDVLNWLNQCEA